MNNYKIALEIYIYFSVFIFILSLIIYFYTKKYSRKKIKIIGLFLDLSKSDIIILSTTILHFIITIYSLINIEIFGKFLISLLIINSLISIIISLNIHIIVAELVYTSITIVVLKLLNLINDFLTNVNYDEMTNTLGLVFSFTIMIYILYITIRKLELVLKKNRFVRRNI